MGVRERTAELAHRLALCQRVIALGHHGHVRYRGTTQFAAGEWVGIEFDESVGNTDGSVDGVRYFQCEPDRGMFLTPDKVSCPHENLISIASCDSEDGSDHEVNV